MVSKRGSLIATFLIAVALKVVSSTLTEPDTLKGNLSLKMKDFQQRVITKIRGHSEDEPSAFMWSLYREKRRRGETNGGAANHGQKGIAINGRERKALRQSNIIKSFSLTDSIKKNDTWILAFDLSNLSTDEKIRYAEIEIASADIVQGTKIIVRVINGKDGEKEDRNDLKTIQLNKDSLTRKTRYDVTTATRRWCRTRKHRGQSVTTKSGELLSQVATLVVFSRNIHVDDLIDVSRDRQGRYRRESYYHSSQHHQRGQQRRRNNKRRRGQVGPEVDLSTEGKDRKEKSAEQFQKHSHCKKFSFEVDFGIIGWNEWIIYPKKYQAYRCEGTCSVAMIQDDMPTNHAFVQSVFSSARPDLGIAEPCCVPTKLRPMSLLYFENGEVVQRNHEDMIVEECGCR